MKNPEKVADALFKSVSEYVAKQLRPLQERILELDLQTKSMTYVGTYNSGRELLHSQRLTVARQRGHRRKTRLVE